VILVFNQKKGNHDPTHTFLNETPVPLDFSSWGDILKEFESQKESIKKEENSIEEFHEKEEIEEEIDSKQGWSQVDPKVIWSHQLELLKSMGFTDDQKKSNSFK